jgi:hypothetical protein
MTLVQHGKEYAEEVREDITLGNVEPQVGAMLTFTSYTDATDPRKVYNDVDWYLEDSSTTINSITLYKWIRVPTGVAEILEDAAAGGST